ncbi:hypothetical protein VF21_02765 [Pseudogymnoascus sp. 05NY08]|nr:hypothetical protein VF21_02765 [Pseudogymnoascus sp. 05NY08]
MRVEAEKSSAAVASPVRAVFNMARSTNTLERHGASILERLEELEQRINHMDKGVDTATHSTRTKENSMTEPLRRAESVNITLHNDNEDPVSMYEGRPCETEIFEAATDNKASTSLTSHIYALKYVLLPNVNHPTTSPSRPNTASRTDPERIDKTQYLRDLPSVQQLRRLIRSYFEHLGYFFPCIDEKGFELRFSQIEEERFLDENGLTILVKPSDSAFIMLMCMVLAIATYLDPNSHKEKSCTSPGWHYLLMAESISRRRRSSIARDLDLDLVRYHTVKAMYMIHIEQLGGAYNAIAVAVQLAFRMGLNDQSLWNDCSDDEKSTRQLLWWTVYYMDRRVAQKCWRPYFIRESEVGVDEPELTNTPRYDSSDSVEETSSSDQNLSANQYIQTQIHWARLWALVWDTFFTVKAKNAGNSTEDVEIMDARILHVQRELDQD